MTKLAQRELARALQLHKAGRFAEAEKNYARYLARHPDDCVALSNAATTALQIGNLTLAIARLERLVALDPRLANVGLRAHSGGTVWGRGSLAGTRRPDRP